MSRDRSPDCCSTDSPDATNTDSAGSTGQQATFTRDEGNHAK